MNEWKSCFFFPGLCFFFPPQKLNEWMTCELFQEKKTHTQKKTQILEKKNSNLRPKKKSYFQGLLQRRARKLLSKPIYRFLNIYTYKKHPLFFSSFWRFGGRFFSKPCFNLFSPSFYLFCWNLFCLSPTANHAFSELLKVYFTLMICHIYWVLFIQIKVVI